MTKQITTYTANVTGISANNLISSASEVTARQNTSTAINNTGEVVTENRALLEAIHTTDHIINVISTSFSGGTNQLAILADAITWWDESVYRADKTANASLTGWPAKTITGLTTSNTFYIWATFVSGTKDYEATNITAALPSNITEKALIGIATVSGAGAVTFAINWQGPTQTRENYFRDTQTFLGGTKGNSRTVTTTDTALTTDNTILLDATAGAFTETLYTAVGNRGRRLTLIKIDSSANAATIDANASETIAGSLTRILYRQFDAFTIESDNANWNVVNEQGKGRVPIREVVVSSPVATVDFSLPSGYNSFELEWFKFQPATDQVILYLRFSTNNGSSYDSGAANYRYAYILPSIANAQPTDTGLNIAGGHGSVAGNIGNASAEGTSGTIKIYNAGDSATRTTIAGLSTWLDSNSSCQNIFVGGGREATQATTNIRVLFSGGNITAGTIRLWGIQ